jgi:hypothetical protein
LIFDQSLTPGSTRGYDGYALRTFTGRNDEETVRRDTFLIKQKDRSFETTFYFGVVVKSSRKSEWVMLLVKAYRQARFIARGVLPGFERHAANHREVLLHTHYPSSNDKTLRIHRQQGFCGSAAA